jgi:hypothetical protein
MRTATRVFAAVLTVATLALPVFAASEKRNEPVGRTSGSAGSIEWQASVDNERILLIVAGPDGRYYSKEFPAGKPISFRTADLDKAASDGTYIYELRLVPRISADVTRRLAAARATGNSEEAARIQQEAGIAQTTVQSGAFTVKGGSFVLSDATEPGANDSARTTAPDSGSGAGVSSSGTTAKGKFGIAAADGQVIATDLIVQGSECVGIDCSATESFGFDTLRLKENNLRINFDDTSSSTGYPNNDWTLTANDSTSGGANKFSVDDVTNSKTPFTIMATAPTNSLFVSTAGDIGLGTATPGLDVHIQRNDTPAIRLAQDNTGGFTAQTWDVAGNEANFFVRDITGGSRLPFRIRPGALTSAVDISSSGTGVGGVATAVGTYVTPLQVISAATAGGFMRMYDSDATYEIGGMWLPNSTPTTGWVVGKDNTGQLVLRYGSGASEQAALTNAKDAGTGIFVNTSGYIGLGTESLPSAPIDHSNGASLSVGGVWTNASSRSYKQNIKDLDSADAMSALNDLQPVTYEYKAAPEEHHVGFIAEDVPEIVATPDRKGLSSMDIVAVLTKVVKEQQKTIDQLSQRIQQIENEQK